MPRESIVERWVVSLPSASSTGNGASDPLGEARSGRIVRASSSANAFEVSRPTGTATHDGSAISAARTR